MSSVWPPLLAPDHINVRKVAELVQHRTYGLRPDPAWTSPDPPSNHPSWAHWSQKERSRFFGYMIDAYPEYEFPFTEETLFADNLVLPPSSYFEGDLPVVEYGGPPKNRSLVTPRPGPDTEWLQNMLASKTGTYVRFADVKLPGFSDSNPEPKTTIVADVSVLSFSKLTTVSVLETSSMAVRRNITALINNNKHLDAAFLAVLSLQHRVIVLDNSYTQEAKDHACKSFPKDIFGPWAPPLGDIVILPAFHGNTSACQQVLKEVKLGLDQLGKHRGKFQETFTVDLCDEKDFIPGTVHRDDVTDEAATRMRHLTKRVPVDKAPYKNSLFRPVFSNYLFRMGSVKLRLAAELVQAAIIVLLKAIDASLLRKDFGAGLYLVQLLRHAIVRFSWMLRYRPLQASYLFGLHKFFEGKCYALFYYNASAGERYVEVRNLFKGAEKIFEAMDDEFQEELNSTGHGDLSYECEIRLPSSSMNCLAVAYQAFYSVAIAPKWKRAWMQKEVIAITYLTRHLRYWKFCIVSEYVRMDQDRRMNHLNKIRGLLDGAVSEPRLSRLCRACFFLLTAQVYQLKNVWQQACALNSMYGWCHAVRAPKWSSPLEVRSRSMQGAMLELAEEAKRSQYVKDPPQPTREVLRSIHVLVATKTFCDGIFDQLLYHGEVNKVYSTCFQPLYNMMALVQDNLAPWVDKPYEQATGKYRLKVNKTEEIYVNQILGLLFYGTALIYYRVIGGNTPTTEAQREVCRNNASFYLTLSMAYLRRPGVAVAILRRVSDLALMYERCLIQVAMKSMRCLVGRATIVMNIFFFLLPMLWELCIDAVTDGPINYTGISVRKPLLPLPLTNIKKKGHKGQMALFESLLKYVCTDLELDGQTSVALKAYSADAKSEITKEVEHSTHECAGELNIFKFNIEFGNWDGEKRPPVPSRYPWGEYHKVEMHFALHEEQTKNLQPFYTVDKFKSLLANFNEQVFTPHEDVENAAKDIMTSMENLCTLIEQGLKDANQKIYMTVATNVELKPSDVSAAIRMYRVYKMQPTSSLVCLTRTMVKLEKVLCGGALTSLMRGEMD